MAKFLSEEWFREVEKLAEIAGDLEIPPTLQSLSLNITVTGAGDSDALISLNGGRLEKGHTTNASTKIILPADLARRLFIEGDQSAGMQGFMSGQIKIEGDMSKLMAMQTAQPSQKQRDLQKQILAITE